jgi:hypothetical protein
MDDASRSIGNAHSLFHRPPRAVGCTTETSPPLQPRAPSCRARDEARCGCRAIDHLRSYPLLAQFPLLFPVGDPGVTKVEILAK